MRRGWLTPTSPTHWCSSCSSPSRSWWWWQKWWWWKFEMKFLPTARRKHKVCSWVPRHLKINFWWKVFTEKFPKLHFPIKIHGSKITVSILRACSGSETRGMSMFFSIGFPLNRSEGTRNTCNIIMIMTIMKIAPWWWWWQGWMMMIMETPWQFHPGSLKQSPRRREEKMQNLSPFDK